MLKFLRKIKDQIRFTRDANSLCKKRNYKMDAIVKDFVRIGCSYTRIRSGYIIHTPNRGIIELVGTDNIIEEIILNPQNEKKNYG